MGPTSKLFTVQLLVFHREEKATVDTAATKSIISRDVIPPKMIVPTEIYLLAANDLALKIVGACSLLISTCGSHLLPDYNMAQSVGPRGATFE